MDQNFSNFQNYQPGEDQEIHFAQIKNASYYRTKARTALKGKFVMASVAALVYNLIIGAIGTVASVFMMVGSLSTLMTGTQSETAALTSMLVSVVITLVVVMVGMIFVGAPLSIGYHRLHLDIVDGKEIGMEKIFSSFKNGYWNSVKVYLLYSLVLFASMLPMMVISFLAGFFGAYMPVVVSVLLALVVSVAAMIVAVMLVYRYAMVFFILAEYPEMRATDVLRSSASMMKGRKWKLFCLDFSFLGWAMLLILVGTCTCGLAAMVGPYPLMAYMTTAKAAFYDDAANREAAREAVFPSLNPDDYTPDADAEEQV